MYHWDEHRDKSRFFDFGDLVAPSEIGDNLGIDTGSIVLSFWGDILMTDHIDVKGIWVETLKTMKSRVLDRDLHILDPAFRYINASFNFSQILQKLEHCTTENAKVLYNRLKQRKLEFKGSGLT